MAFLMFLGTANVFCHIEKAGSNFLSCAMWSLCYMIHHSVTIKISFSECAPCYFFLFIFLLTLRTDKCAFALFKKGTDKTLQISRLAESSKQWCASLGLCAYMCTFTYSFFPPFLFNFISRLFLIIYIPATTVTILQQLIHSHQNSITLLIYY